MKKGYSLIRFNEEVVDKSEKNEYFYSFFWFKILIELKSWIVLFNFLTKLKDWIKKMNKSI